MALKCKAGSIFPIRLLAVFTIFSLFISATPQKQQEEFKWEDASKEVDGLPFTQAFIDSIKQLNKLNSANPLNASLINTSICRSETLVYEVSWGPFKAGYAVLTTQPDPATKTIKLGAKALSNNFVSSFYKMRDYIISTIDDSGRYPLFFEQHLREGKKYKSDGWILYDRIGSKLLVQDKKFKTLDAPAPVHDYVSVIHYVRSMNAACGDTFSLRLFVNSKIQSMHFKVKEQKQIQVDAGTFNCIKVEPRLVGDKGAFNKKDKLEVWLTNDKNRIPVVFWSKINVGAITAKLIWCNLLKNNAG
jgi:hypothetical protein